MLLPVLLMLIGGLSRAWIADDGLINARVVEVVTSGGGLSFSEGIRTETATSLLWILILAGAHAVTGLPADGLAVWLGLTATVGGMALAARALVRQPPGATPTVAIGLVGYATIGFAWDFATSGLENGLVLLWLGGVAALLRRSEMTWTGWVVLGLGPLLRPDLALISAVVLVIALRRERLSFRASVGRISIALALPVAATFWRAAYYGIAIPNTGVAKEGTSLRIGQGLEYLWVSMSRADAVLTVLLVALGLVASRRGLKTSPGRSETATVQRAMGIAGALHLSYIVVVGGDFMLGRLLLPGLFSLAIAVGTIPIPADRRLQRLAIACLLIAMMAPNLVPPLLEGDIKDERAYYAAMSGHAHPVSAHDHLDGGFGLRSQAALRTAPPGTLVILPSGSGSEPVILPLAPEVADRYRHILVGSVLGTTAAEAGPNVAVLDQIGLADPVAAHQLLVERGRPGHEKSLAAEWYVARFTSPDTPVPDGLDADRVAAARQALGCGRLAELHRATTADLTRSQLTENLLSSLSLTFFRFHPDPLVAVDELC